MFEHPAICELKQGRCMIAGEVTATKIKRKRKKANG
jgi:hypothetical protein